MNGARGWLFRTRYVVYGAICVLGLMAPWDAALHLDGSGPNAHLWGVLAVALSKAGVTGIAGAFDLLLALGITFAAIGAGLRTWAQATGYAKPRYAGAWLLTAAIALLMPVSGAVFALVLTTALLGALVAVAEPGASGPMSLGRAVLLEVYGWSVAGSYAAAGWRYNAALLVRCVLVAAGAGLVVRGLLPGRTPAE